jgi:D-3-phosphoglycerate dehydrogenase
MFYDRLKRAQLIRMKKNQSIFTDRTMSNKQQILLIKPGFKDFSIENNLLSSTPYELVVVTDEDNLLSSISNPLVIGVITVDTPITAEIIESISPSCRVITRLGVGFDIINIQACLQRNIIVCYVPDYGTNEVADHAVALLFAAHRRLSIYHRSIIEENIWNHEIVGTDLHSLNTLNLGVIGMGRIGSCFATKMRPFVKQIFSYDPFVPSNCASIDEIFEYCDIISLHVPLTSTNHHLISSESINRMKRRPILINVSRGGLIDTQALIQAVKTGQISYAALDVLENEPKIDPELIQLDRIQLTPHAAWYTRESESALRTKAIQDILRVMNKEQPIYPVPV